MAFTVTRRKPSERSRAQLVSPAFRARGKRDSLLIWRATDEKQPPAPWGATFNLLRSRTSTASGPNAMVELSQT